MAPVHAALDAIWALWRGFLGWLIIDIPNHDGNLHVLASRTRQWWRLRSLRTRIATFDRSLPLRERLDP